MIDDKFFLSEKFCAMPATWRLMLIGMVVKADDQGRITAHPAMLRSLVMPFEDIPLKEVEAFLNRLVELNTIVIYEGAGAKLAQFVNWWNYQEHMQYAEPSKFPPPDGWADHVRFNYGRGQVLTSNWVRRDGSVMPDSCDQWGNPLPPDDSGPPPAPSQPPLLGSAPETPEAQGDKWRIVNDDPPSGPKPGAVSANLPPQRKGELTRAAQQRKSARLAIDPRRFVQGKIPAGKGLTPFEVYFEFVAVSTVVIADYNAERINETVKDLDRWRSVLEAWFGVQHKPDNFTGLLKWYSEGIPEYASSEYHPKARPANDKGATSGNQDAGGNRSLAGSGIPLGERATLDHNQAAQLFGRRRVSGVQGP